MISKINNSEINNNCNKIVMFYPNLLIINY